MKGWGVNTNWLEDRGGDIWPLSMCLGIARKLAINNYPCIILSNEFSAIYRRDGVSISIYVAVYITATYFIFGSKNKWPHIVKKKISKTSDTSGQSLASAPSSTY